MTLMGLQGINRNGFLWLVLFALLALVASIIFSIHTCLPRVPK